MMVIMLSLAGVPPLVGFFSKFYLFKLAIEQGHVTLTVIALLTSAVAAYYYLGVVALMYFKEPAAEAAPRAMGTVTTWVVGAFLRPGAGGDLLRSQAAGVGRHDHLIAGVRRFGPGTAGSAGASWAPPVPA